MAPGEVGHHNQKLQRTLEEYIMVLLALEHTVEYNLFEQPYLPL